MTREANQIAQALGITPEEAQRRLHDGEIKLGPLAKLAPEAAAKIVSKQGEAEFATQVIKRAQALGWRVAHFRPAQTAKGWRTAVQGDGKGFPDLILVRGPLLIAAELKCGKNKPSAAQWAWLKAFGAAGVPYFVWYPRDWKKIDEVLTGFGDFKGETSAGKKKAQGGEP